MPNVTALSHNKLTRLNILFGLSSYQFADSKRLFAKRDNGVIDFILLIECFVRWFITRDFVIIKGSSINRKSN